MRAFQIALAAVLLLPAGNVAANTAGRAEAAIYSNLCDEPESGDEDGIRITVLRFVEDDYLAFQFAEGWANAPDIVPAKIGRDSHFSADVTAGYIQHMKLTGVISPKRIVLYMPIVGNKPQRIVLPRVSGHETLGRCAVIPFYARPK